MEAYADQKSTATLNGYIEGIAASRSRIEEGTTKIFAQLERLGFFKPLPQPPTTTVGATNGPALTPRERTALEALEYNATNLEQEAGRVEHIAQLLNNQF